jgi:hypothetical protein
MAGTEIQQLQQRIRDLERELAAFKRVNEELTDAVNYEVSATSR